MHSACQNFSSIYLVLRRYPPALWFIWEQPYGLDRPVCSKSCHRGISKINRVECTCDERPSIRSSFCRRARKGESLKSDFDNMSVEELWLLRDAIIQALRRRITQEKRELERRLALLHSNLPAKTVASSAQHRPHPKVVPRYRNPAEPVETWSGRGKRPK